MSATAQRYSLGVIEVDLVGVRVEVPANTPVVVLREREGHQRVLTIFIGAPEATAIAFALEGVETPRPLTHDLFESVLDELGVRLEQVVVTSLVDTTFFAELYLRTGNEVTVVSSRPSDALALAARIGCPIYVEDVVIDEAGVIEVSEADLDDPELSDEVVEEFRQFIDSVNPDDFAS